jgi:hypothetical protein
MRRAVEADFISTEVEGRKKSWNKGAEVMEVGWKGAQII